MRRPLLAGSLVLGVVRTLAGCGSDADATDPAGAPPPVLDGAAPPPPADGAATGDGGTPVPATRWSRLGVLGASLAVGPDALYLVGTNPKGNDVVWTIEKRSLGDGDLVTSFGVGGIVEVPLPPGSSMSYGLDVVADAEGITVVGHFGAPSNENRIERRRTSDGALLWNTTTSLCARQNYLADDATAVYVGCFGVLEKRTKASGARDLALRDSGVATWPSPSNGGLSVSVLQGRDTAGPGALLEFGQRAVVGPSDYERYVALRSMETGIAQWEVVKAGAAATSAASDGAAVFVASPIASGWTVEKRALADGAAITAFGSAGVISNADATEFDLRPLVTHRDGRLYLATRHTDPTTSELSTDLRAFDAVSGAPIESFGQAGRILSPRGTKDPNATGIGGFVADATSLYVVDTVFADGGRIRRLQRRDRATGAL